MPGADEKSIEQAYGRNYIRAHYVWTQIFTEHLADCSRAFRGDLHAVLILAVIGQSYLARHLHVVGTHRDPAEPAPVLEGAAINATSLAEIVGIPRETVRRKLEELRRAGWIERNEKAEWQLAIVEGQAPARRNLADLDRRGIARVARLAAELHALAEAHAPSP